jgi:hypothetical protein
VVPRLTFEKTVHLFFGNAHDFDYICKRERKALVTCFFRNETSLEQCTNLVFALFMDDKHQENSTRSSSIATPRYDRRTAVDIVRIVCLVVHCPRRCSTHRKRHSSLSRTASSTISSDVIHFACQQRANVEQWDTSYFLSLIFELLDDFKDNGRSQDESRLVAFLVCRINDIHFSTLIPMKLVLQILQYIRNVRLKLLVLVELLPVSEQLDCEQALALLWQFASYGYMTLFYVLDRIKFSLVNKDTEWKALLTIFEPLANKKHAAFIVLDKTNFYKPNRASITFGSKRVDRYF